MNSEKFAITAEGQVYLREGRDWRCLGHLGSILYEEGALGRELRDWWQARLESDEPGEENIVVVGKNQYCFVSSRAENGDQARGEEHATLDASHSRTS